MIFLQQLFAHICGQQHVWILDGQTLPFCQRCTGLYTGILIAVLLTFAFRLRPTRFQYWLHGAFLLLMIPYGFHFVPQGPFLRTTSGFLFAFGLVYFLVLNTFTAWQLWKTSAAGPTIAYLLLILAALAALLAIVHFGGRTWAVVVAAVSALGCAALCLLVVANIAILPGTFRHLTRGSRAGAA